MYFFVVFLLGIFSSFQSVAMEGIHRKTKLDFGFEFNNLGSFEDDFVKFLQSRAPHERRVVEFGAGYGRIAKAIVTKIEDVDYLCTDISEEQIQEINESIPTLLFAKGARLNAVACDCTKDLRVEDESVDAVMIANVFHFLHLREAIAVLDRAQRILKPGGRIFVMSQTPHFVLSALVKNIKEKEGEIATRRRIRNLKMKELSGTTDLKSLLSGFAKAQELDLELDDILEEEKELNRQQNLIFWPACYSTIYKIYRSNNLPFSGYCEKEQLGGNYCFENGNHKPHYPFERKYSLHLTSEDMQQLAKPFGFTLVSSREYIFAAQEIIEITPGSSLGIIFSKDGERETAAIEKLKSDAEQAHDLRAQFHANKVVEYYGEFPCLKVGTPCGITDCKRVGNLLCAKCKAKSYCSKECQRKDWPKHKLVCKTCEKK